MRYVRGIRLKKNSWRWVAAASLILTVAILVFWRYSAGWYSRSLRPLDPNGINRDFRVEQGASVLEIGDSLEMAGLIRSGRAFAIYVERQGDVVLKSGLYSLSPALSVPQIAAIIANGDVKSSLVTIPPGLRLDQVALKLVAAGFSKSEVDAALTAEYDHPLLKYRPAGASLEGYIYPESFAVTEDSQVKDVIRRAFDELYGLLDDDLRQAISRQGLSIHQAFTLASIVQKEVNQPQTQRQVAQVFLRRLKLGMPLGSDVTFFYAAAIANTEPSPNLDSPYNTRLHQGLPPGPIANFSISALRAVAYPAEGDYLYFVSGDDGNTYFARTLEEHQQNVAKYCSELCKL